MSWSSKLWAPACAALLLSAPRVASAQDGELPVAVLTVSTLDAFEQADALSLALKRAVEDAPGWSTAKTQKDYALQALVPSLGCADPPDAACEAKIADEIKVDRFVWGTMKKDGTDVSGELHFWVRGKGSSKTSYKYSSNLTVAVDEALAGIAKQKFEELAGGPATGKVTVRAGNHDGTVTVDGKPAGTLKGGVAVLDLAPGPHSIGVDIAGYEPTATQVEVKPREAKEVSLSPSAKAEKGPPLQQIFGFTLLGLGAAGAGVGAYGGVKSLQLSSEIEDNYRGDITNGKQACDAGPNGDYPNANGVNAAAIIDLCEEGDTYEMMHFVAFPVAGALGITGIILLATADWSGGDTEEAAKVPVEVTPRIGPLGGDVSVRVRF